LKLHTFVPFELQKIAETNQDSTSKAPNMQINRWCLLRFLTRSRWSQEKFDALLLDHSAFGQILTRGSTGTRN